MKRQHIIILSALILAILIAFLGGRTVAHNEEILIKDSLINMRDVALSDLKDEYNILDEEFKLIKTEYEKAEETNYSLNSQLVLIEKSLKDTKKELDNATTEKTNIVLQMQKLQKQLLEYTGSDDYLNNVLAEKNKTIERLETEKTELEKQLASERDKNILLVAKLQEIQFLIAQKSDSIFDLSKQIDLIIDNKNYVSEHQQIETLKREKNELRADIELLNKNIKTIKKEIPPIYSQVIYYFAIIKKHVPGKILRQKDTIKFYLDQNDDFADDINEIYLSFDINRQIFFDTIKAHKLIIELKSDIMTDKLVYNHEITKEELKFEEKIFENLTLKQGTYFISIFSETSKKKVIDDYKFILN